MNSLKTLNTYLLIFFTSLTAILYSPESLAVKAKDVVVEIQHYESSKDCGLSEDSLVGAVSAILRQNGLNVYYDDKELPSDKKPDFYVDINVNTLKMRDGRCVYSNRLEFNNVEFTYAQWLKKSFVSTINYCTKSSIGFDNVVDMQDYLNSNIKTMTESCISKLEKLENQSIDTTNVFR